jgi:hypothetical protein
VRARKQMPTVSRNYQPVPEDCTQALALLLEAPTHKEVARPAPEPDDCDGIKVKGDSADGRIIPH